MTTRYKRHLHGPSLDNILFGGVSVEEELPAEEIEEREDTRREFLSSTERRVLEHVDQLCGDGQLVVNGLAAIIQQGAGHKAGGMFRDRYISLLFSLADITDEVRRIAGQFFQIALEIPGAIAIECADHLDQSLAQALRAAEIDPLAFDKERIRLRDIGAGLATDRKAPLFT
jgi:hypothetical protein